MIPVQRDAAIAIGGAREEGASERALELLGGIQTPFGLSQHLQGDGGSKPLLEQALVGGGVVELQKVLMGLLELQQRLRQGKLIVIQAPLDVEMCLHQVHVALALGAHNRVVVNAQTRTDPFKGVGDEGSPTV